jgi:large subunit ribosomal protein L4
MPTVAIVNTQGQEVGKRELSASVFASEINLFCVRIAVNRQLARRRQGTAATKTKGLVRGGGIKPWRQKGTGRARCGSNRSPLWRGGGTMFGPQPRQYGGQINRKVTRQAIVSCLSSMATDERIRIIDQIEFSEPKTKQAVALLKTLGIEAGSRVLMLTKETNFNLAMSTRNLQAVDIINCDNLNCVDLTTHDVIVATRDAIERIEEIYG